MALTSWSLRLTYRIQQHPRAMMMAVHLDRLTPHIGITLDEQPWGGSSAMWVSAGWCLRVLFFQQTLRLPPPAFFKKCWMPHLLMKAWDHSKNITCIWNRCGKPQVTQPKSGCTKAWTCVWPVWKWLWKSVFCAWIIEENSAVMLWWSNELTNTNWHQDHEWLWELRT
jgi:hypothetical protein